MFDGKKGGRKAGRKPKGERALVSRRRRAPLASRFPVHVTVRVKRGLPSMRRREAYRAIRTAFAAGCERFGFRLTQYSVQVDHLHLLAEAKDRRALSRGMQGLLIRVARGLNRCWGRRGKVFADRYHDRILRTPREVRHALCYVLHNAKKHGQRVARGVDVFASVGWFDGWKEEAVAFVGDGVAKAVAAAKTWLLTIGWRRHGLLGFDEAPREVGR